MQHNHSRQSTSSGWPESLGGMRPGVLGGMLDDSLLEGLLTWV